MNRIKLLRQAEGWTQQDLAMKMNTAKSVISRYETGRLGLDSDLIERFCDIFDCSADYLICLSDARHPVLSDDDARLLAAYHALPVAIRQAVDGLIAPYLSHSQEEKETATS